MQDVNPSKTPTENNLELIKATEDQQLFEKVIYRNLGGSLQYITKQTKPDIFWEVNGLSRFVDKQQVDWQTRSPLSTRHKVSEVCLTNSI